MISEISDTMAEGSFHINLSMSQDGLKRLWSQPVQLFRLANALRSRSCNDEVSFVVNRNINFTNECIGSCRFCSFKHSNRYFLTHEQILERASDAERRGASEICLQGGLSPRMHLEDYCEILELIHRDFPKMHLHAYSPMEVMHMSQNSNVEVVDALAELKKSGLGSMPGTAAEVLVDSVRKRICPDKVTTKRVARDNNCSAPAWHPLYLYTALWPRGEPGRSPPASSDPKGYSGRDPRVYGVGAASFYS